jgi:large subunit ribosomal protein L1
MGKRHAAAAALVQPGRRYTLAEAVALVKQCATAKFDETVEVTVRLGIDPKQSDQTVRTAVVLPHGSGTVKRIVVIAKGDKEREAQAAGADAVGAEDLVAKIAGGWLDFDVVVATPDMMREVGKLGKVLGPKGLMPNPKSGTVTTDVARIVKETKAGRVELRNDAYGIVHAAVGKASFPAEHLVANVAAVLDAILRARPPAAKGAYVRRAFLSSTMGPGIELDAGAIGGGER